MDWLINIGLVVGGAILGFLGMRLYRLVQYKLRHRREFQKMAVQEPPVPEQPNATQSAVEDPERRVVRQSKAKVYPRLHEHR